MKRRAVLLSLFILAVIIVMTGAAFTKNQPIQSAVSKDGYWKGWIVRLGDDSYTGYLSYQGQVPETGEIRMQYCGDTACRYGVLSPDEEPFGLLQALILGSKNRTKYSIAAYPPGVPEALQYVIEWQEGDAKQIDSLEW